MKKILIEQQFQQSLNLSQTEFNFNEQSQDLIHQSELFSKKTVNKDLLLIDNKKLISYLTVPKNSGLLPETKYNMNAIKTCTYPISQTFRMYQFKIIETAFFYNTLVFLPQGCGKHFTTSILMANYYHWFPESKIIVIAKSNYQHLLDEVKNQNIISQDIIAILNNQLSLIKKQDLILKKSILLYNQFDFLQDLRVNKLINPQHISLIILHDALQATQTTKELLQYIDKQAFGYRIVGYTDKVCLDYQEMQLLITDLLFNKIIYIDQNSQELPEKYEKKTIKPIIIEGNDQQQIIKIKLNILITQSYQWLINQKIIPQNIQNKIQNPSNITRELFNEIYNYFEENLQETQEKLGEELMQKAFEQMRLLSQLCQGKQIMIEKGLFFFTKWLQVFQQNTANKFGRENLAKKSLIESDTFKNIVTIINQSQAESERNPKLAQLLNILEEFNQNSENQQQNITTSSISKKVQIVESIKSRAFELRKVLLSKYNNCSIKQQQYMTNNEQIDQNMRNSDQDKIIITINEPDLQNSYDIIVLYDFDKLIYEKLINCTNSNLIIFLLQEKRELRQFKDSEKCKEKQIETLNENSVNNNFKLIKKKFQFYCYNSVMLPESSTISINYIGQDNMDAQENNQYFIQKSSQIQDNNKYSTLKIENIELNINEEQNLKLKSNNQEELSSDSVIIIQQEKEVVVISSKSDNNAMKNENNINFNIELNNDSVDNDIGDIGQILKEIQEESISVISEHKEQESESQNSFQEIQKIIEQYEQEQSSISQGSQNLIKRKQTSLDKNKSNLEPQLTKKICVTNKKII